MSPLRRREIGRPGSARLGIGGLTAAVGLALLGCGGPREEQRPASLMVYIPCVISAPMNEVLESYRAAHPEVALPFETGKPLALLGKVVAEHKGPTAVITMGDVEMEWLVGAGAVEAADVRTIAVNILPLALAAGESAAGVEELADLAGPGAKRIYIEDPSQSSLGDRTERALKKLGLWEKVAPKVVRPDPEAMVLSELIEGRADAAAVFRDCLFAEIGDEASLPKRVRIIAEIPEETYSPIPYQAAPLRGTERPEVAREFVDFLTSEEGQQAIARAGLRPAERP